MRTAFGALALLAASSSYALDLVPPPYQAREEVAGVVRVWGNAEAKDVVVRWQEGFRRANPQVRFENHLTGSDVGMAGLYTGKADIAFLGRDAAASEVKAFEWIYRYRPERVEIMTGADRPGRSPALVAYVHRDNPLARLTLAQLDAIFSHERLRGAPDEIRTWGELGLAGDWAAKPINLHTFDTESGTGRYFRDVALKDSRKLHWDRIKEYKDTPGPMPRHDAGRRILDALAADRYGLAVASGAAPGEVKALALGDGDAAVAATRENLVSRRYPFARAFFAYYNHKPDTQLDAPVAQFLRYVLSAEGQREVREADGYLPLDASLARAQSQKTAQNVDSLPAYSPAQKQEPLDGVIRTWGHGSRDADFIGPLVRSWESGFRKLHPAVRFETSLLGDKSAIGGLYTGAADMALMERGLSAIEKDSYEQVFGRTDPFEVTVATGSLDVPNHAPALVIFVHKDNPLAKLTLAQLDAVFGADRRRGAQDIRTWDALGLGGSWTGKPIHAYGFPIEDDASQYFQNAVMGGSQKWTGDLTELAGRRTLDALAKDRHGIAISHLQYRNPQVKPVALAVDDAGPYVEPTRETVLERKYPLTRAVQVYINREPGKLPDPKLKEYLRYILGPEGQGDIARDGGYLPLTPDEAQRQWRRVE